MTRTETDLLAALLGSHDALHEPHVTVANPWHWQRLYAFTGRFTGWPIGPGAMPLPDNSADAAARKRMRRTLRALADSGHITMPCRGLFAFTDSGLRHARELVGRPTPEACLPGLDFLLALDDTAHGFEGWFTEASAFGFPPIPSATPGTSRLPAWCAGAVSYLTPLVAAGLLDVNCAVGCELPLYIPTPEGRNLALRRRDDGTADPAAWVALVRKPLPDAPAAYETAWLQAVEFFTHAEPLRPNRVRHPVCVHARRAAATISAPVVGVAHGGSQNDE